MTVTVRLAYTPLAGPCAITGESGKTADREANDSTITNEAAYNVRGEW